MQNPYWNIGIVGPLWSSVLSDSRVPAADHPIASTGTTVPCRTMDDHEIGKAAGIHLQHFSVAETIKERRTFLHSMLTSAYRTEHSINFSAARSLVLLGEGVVTGTAAVCVQVHGQPEMPRGHPFRNVSGARRNVVRLFVQLHSA